MQEVTFKEVRRILQDYAANPFQLNSAGERMLQLMAEIHENYNNLYLNLGAELEEEAPAVVPSAVPVEPAPELPPTPVSRRFRREDFPSEQPSTPNRNHVGDPACRSRLSRVDRSLIRPRRLFFDSPPASPTEVVFLTEPTTPIREPPTLVPNAPSRPRRTIPIDRSTLQPLRLFFDSPPSTPVRNTGDVQSEVPRTPQDIHIVEPQENTFSATSRRHSQRGTKRRIEDDRTVPTMDDDE